MSQRERNYHAAFQCPKCGHANRNPVVVKPEGRSDYAVCDGCGIEVSGHVIRDAQDRADAARRKAINEWAGWGVDVV